MARHHKVLDTLSIYSASENTLKLKTGDGEEEVVNAVVPLFG